MTPAMTAHEIERKWLIARPDEALLAAQPDASPSQIVQTYLTAPDGISRRVRARTRDGITTYTTTEKRRIDAMTAEETETVITADTYAALLQDADPTCRPIEKTRWRIPHAGRLLEIDLYPFWDAQAVLEIELPTPDAAVSLPPYLTVLREVTGDRTYSNHSLSRAIPQQIV